MHRRLFPIGFVCVSLIVIVLPANADLTGDTVNGSFTHGALVSFAGSAIVGGTREFQAPLSGPIDAFADLTANTVTVGFQRPPAVGATNQNSFSGTWLFTNLDWLPTPGAVTGLTLLSASSVVPQDFANTGWLDDPSNWALTFTDDSIQMSGDMDFLFTPAGGSVFATFQIETQQAAVPAPSAARHDWPARRQLGEATVCVDSAAEPATTSAG